jgi:hypothetical protein
VDTGKRKPPGQVGAAAGTARVPRASISRHFLHAEPKQHLPSFQIARRPLKRYFPTNPLHMKLNRLREFFLILKRNLRRNPAEVRLDELRQLSLMLWICMAFLVCGQFIPNFGNASSTKWLIIVALLSMTYALQVIRTELRDLRKAVTKDVP